MLNGSGLGMISSLRLDNGLNIQSAESTWSVLNSELETCVLPTLDGNSKSTKTSSHYQAKAPFLAKYQHIFTPTHSNLKSYLTHPSNTKRLQNS